MRPDPQLNRGGAALAITTARPSVPPAAHAAEVRALQRMLVDTASERYRGAGLRRFAYHFARGKLGGDPMFIELLRLGALAPAGDRGTAGGLDFLDLGCGQAVLASWLLAARERFDAGHWPAGWPEPPPVARVRALELMPADVARARLAFAQEPRVTVEQADICAADFGRADVITVLDMLHYIAPAGQDDVLRRARAALGPGGLLVMRVGDASAGLRFQLSRWADQAITLARGHGLSQLHCRPLADWMAALRALGFEVQSAPTPGGLPFANTFLFARVPGAAS